MRFENSGGLCGMWSLSPNSSCKVCVAGLERDGCFGLSGAEMKMIEVVRDRLIERRQVGVDQHMMVPGIRAIRSGRRDAHVLQAEMMVNFDGTTAPSFSSAK